MSIREISQWFTLLLSIAILSMSLAGAYLRPDRRWWLAIAGVYALIDIAFYMIVLVFGLGALGNDLSPYRSVMQDSIVLAVIYAFLRGDFRKWVQRWR